MENLFNQYVKSEKILIVKERKKERKKVKYIYSQHKT